ncbi:MAG: 4-(cytidine 5'-diphospho)-2-C-methyl-D-erythritol kinase, partial [Spirochaetaceae bacterium]|nr:4-(cytidine 5'-diphospho)-2-C-methyl-D-erythritol kinase [Spirochaetaceae bacterium]
MTINAPCKVNLDLTVGGLRADGFHDIESVFAAFTLCDTLKFEVSEAAGDDELQLDTTELPLVFAETLDPDCLPPEKNLVYRAIKLFKRKTGFRKRTVVRVYKRIPPAAGLGGGSSDAAAALLAMNALSGEPIAHKDLLRLAAELGSDIPFFIELISQRRAEGGFRSVAFVSGRGERVKLAAAPLWDIVIVNPG